MKEKIKVYINVSDIVYSENVICELIWFWDIK